MWRARAADRVRTVANFIASRGGSRPQHPGMHFNMRHCAITAAAPVIALAYSTCSGAIWECDHVRAIQDMSPPTEAGIPVPFGRQPSLPSNTPDGVYEDDEDDDNSEHSSITDPGISYAGAAVRARREELNLSQRQLAAAGIVNAGALGAFEKGKRWPRKTTRTRIEDALQLPHGYIARKRREGNAATTQSTDVDSNTVHASMMTEAVEVALTTINAAIAALPEATDPAFNARVGAVLADLRRLEAVAANAAQSTKGNPDVALTLSGVRKRYKDLMLRAARTPGATLGQQLYAARHRTELTVEETANAAGVPVEVITSAEAEVPLDDRTMTALSAALSALARRQ